MSFRLWQITLVVAGLTASSAILAAEKPADDWSTQKVGEITVRIPPTWQELYNSPTDGGGWYLGKLKDQAASFTMVREADVSAYTRFTTLRTKDTNVSGWSATFYDGVSRNGRTRLWLVITKRRLSDGRRIVLVASSPVGLWVEYEPTYRKIFQGVTIPGGKDAGPTLTTAAPWAGGGDVKGPGAELWLNTQRGKIVLQVPATWRRIPGIPRDEGGWYVGKIESPDGSLCLVREKDFDSYTQRLTVRNRVDVGVAGHPATFYDCVSKSGKHTLWMLILKAPLADGRKVGFVAASPTSSWATHEPVYKRMFQSAKVPGGTGTGPQIASTPPWPSPKPPTMPAPPVKPQPPISVPPSIEPQPPVRPEPPTKPETKPQPPVPPIKPTPPVKPEPKPQPPVIPPPPVTPEPKPTPPTKPDPEPKPPPVTPEPKPTPPTKPDPEPKPPPVTPEPKPQPPIKAEPKPPPVVPEPKPKPPIKTEPKPEPIPVKPNPEPDPPPRSHPPPHAPPVKPKPTPPSRPGSRLPPFLRALLFADDWPKTDPADKPEPPPPGQKR